MLDKMSDQAKIGFLFGEGKLDKLNRMAESIENVANCQTDNVDSKVKDSIESQRTKKADYHDMSAGSSKIMSSSGGNITDIGGPRKQMNSQTSNSIFDCEVLDRLRVIKDSSEETAEIKSNVNRVRNSINDEVMNNLAESLKSTDQRKSSTVSPMSQYSGSSYNKPANGLSIFDQDMNFERVPEKSDGEKLSAKLAEDREKSNDSWRDTSKANSIRSLEDRLIDSFMNREKDNEK